jgi:excinuclease ABC subunit C
VAVVSLAKRIEEVFIPGRRAPLVLAHDTPELQLLQRSATRRTASRSPTTARAATGDDRSLLDELPGVGPARKRALLTHFGSPERSRRLARGAPGGAGPAGEGRRELHAHLHRAG